MNIISTQKKSIQLVQEILTQKKANQEEKELKQLTEDLSRLHKDLLSQESLYLNYVEEVKWKGRSIIKLEERLKTLKNLTPTEQTQRLEDFKLHSTRKLEPLKRKLETLQKSLKDIKITIGV